MPIAKKLTRFNRLFAERVANGEIPTQVIRAMRPDITRPDILASKLMKMPQVRELVETLKDEALAQLGVTRFQILKDLVSVKNRCMQAEPVLQRDGTHALVETPDGEVAKAYVFNSKGAISALDLLGRHKRLWNDDTKPPAQVGPGLTIMVHNGGQVAIQQNINGTLGHVAIALPKPA